MSWWLKKIRGEVNCFFTPEEILHLRTRFTKIYEIYSSGLMNSYGLKEVHETREELIDVLHMYQYLYKVNPTSNEALKKVFSVLIRLSFILSQARLETEAEKNEFIRKQCPSISITATDLI